VPPSVVIEWAGSSAGAVKADFLHNEWTAVDIWRLGVAVFLHRGFDFHLSPPFGQHSLTRPQAFLKGGPGIAESLRG